MNKEQLIALGLNDDQASKVLEGFKGYVPPQRFNEVNEAKKAHEATIAERDKQLAELKKGAGDNESLKAQIEQLMLANKEAQKKYEADLQAIQLNNAISNALAAAGAHDAKAVLPFLDMSKIQLDGESLKGFEEQLKGVMESKKFLFANKQPTPPTGMPPTDGKNLPSGGAKDVSEMTYTEMLEYAANGGQID